MEQVFHNVFVGTGSEHFQFVKARAEAGAAHQVSIHIEVGGRGCHNRSLLSDIRVVPVFYQSWSIVQG